MYIYLHIIYIYIYIYVCTYMYVKQVFCWLVTWDIASLAVTVAAHHVIYEARLAPDAIARTSPSDSCSMLAKMLSGQVS